MVQASFEGPSTVEVLRKQELSRHYQCRDYLSNSNGSKGVTESTRAEMLEWVSNVTAFLKLDECGDDIAVLTATLLDRFSQTTKGTALLSSVPDFRLATMTCLYLIIKVHAHEPTSSVRPYLISAEIMAAFSHGTFTAAQVEDMELTILKAMQWHISPPTALNFVREFLLLLPCSVSAGIKDQAYDLCHEQIQRSITDYAVFAQTEASTIAFVVVQKALKSLGMDDILLGHISSIFSYATHTDYSTSSNDLISYWMAEADPAVTALPVSSHSILKRRSSRKERRQSSSKTSSTSARSRWARQQKRMDSSLDESPCGVAMEASTVAQQ